MEKEKTKHITFRNSNLFCSHCGKSETISYPIEIPAMTKMIDQFTEKHTECEPTWKQPEADNALNEKERMDFWLQNGERGISSETMFQVIGGVNLLGGRICHPCDPDDFRRCYLLIKTIPEWREKLDKMKTVSPIWSRIVDNWDRLCEMLEEQIETKKPNGMYEFMESLGCN